MVMPVHVVEAVQRIEREDDLDPFDIARVRPSWFSQAACAGGDIEVFFPSRGEDCDDARLICDRCPGREECLDFLDLLAALVRHVLALPFTWRAASRMRAACSRLSIR